MKSIISRKDELVSNYSDTVFTLFKKAKYGIQCGPMGDLLLKKALSDVAVWQCKLGDDVANVVDITLISNLPSLQTNVPFIIGGMQQKNSTRVQLHYVLGVDDQVIIDSDGCKTDVTIIPGSDMYTFTQSIAASVWIITHNLGFHPNVRTEDLAGVNIHGTIVDDPGNPGNRLTITFSIPVAGKAYLS